ncbi:unnamed protein product [Victoria cruziana]
MKHQNLPSGVFELQTLKLNYKSWISTTRVCLALFATCARRASCAREIHYNVVRFGISQWRSHISAIAHTAPLNFFIDILIPQLFAHLYLGAYKSIIVFECVPFDTNFLVLQLEHYLVGTHV